MRTHPEVLAFLEGVQGVVEATRFEQMMLWKENRDTGRRTWKENLSGFLPTVGRIGDDPICISILTAEIDGIKVLIYHATSQVVDHRVIDRWLEENLPATARREDGRLNKTDADNFGHIFPYRPAVAA